MAYQYLTMLDIAKLNSSDDEVGLIEENLNSAPELEILPARTITGTSYDTLIRTDFARPQFRNANEGTEPVKSAYANKLVQCYILDGQLEMDKAVADASEDGPDYVLSMEADGVAKGAMLELGSQVWYGTTVDPKGFPGAQEIVDTALVSDAGGTTASTGSSVYALKLGPKFVQLVFGRGNILTLGPWRTQTITRASKEMDAYKNSLLGWVGMQWVNKNAVGRLKDITEDSGKTLTDSMIASWLSKFPVGMWPDRLFMTRRSGLQLQLSRTVTIFGSTTGSAGARSQMPISSPQPVESNGVPIIYTDSLTNTEALTA